MRYPKPAQALLLAVALIGAFSSACSSPSRGESIPAIPPGGTVIRGAGATFPSLLYKKWFAEYQNADPATVVSYDAVGSGEGVQRFIAGKIDFGASDAAMTDQQIAEVPKGVIMLPATAASVVLAYNLPDFQGELRLSRKAYTGIFLGDITNWNDPAIAASNPGVRLPKLTIAVVVRHDGSGTTFAFTKHLDAISETWRARYGAATLVGWPSHAMQASGNENVAGRIQQSVGSIGYVGYEFAQRLGLRMARLENKEGNFVRPDGNSARAALAAVDLPENLRVFAPDPSGRDAYPIVTFSWILLYRHYDDPSKAKAVHDLLRWCLRDGQQFAPALGYIQLSQNVTSRALSALDVLAPAP
jgi:phosphate transport system substrate-binding protein